MSQQYEVSFKVHSFILKRQFDKTFLIMAGRCKEWTQIPDQVKAKKDTEYLTGTPGGVPVGLPYVAGLPQQVFKCLPQTI